MAAKYDHLLSSRNFCLALSRRDFLGFFVEEEDAVDFLLELVVVGGFLDESSLEEDAEFLLPTLEVSEYGKRIQWIVFQKWNKINISSEYVQLLPETFKMQHQQQMSLAALWGIQLREFFKLRTSR